MGTVTLPDPEKVTNTFGYALERGAQPGPFDEYVARVHPEDRERFTAAVGHSVADGLDYELEFRVVHPDGQVRWLWTRAHVLADDSGATSLLIGLTSDITERKQREDTLEFIAQASAALAGLRDPVTALEQVAELAVPRLADWCVVQLLDDDSGLRNVAVAHVDPEKVRWARELEARYPPDTTAPTGAPEVIRTGRSEIAGHRHAGFPPAATRPRRSRSPAVRARPSRAHIR